MDPMPAGDPWSSVAALLEAEAKIRNGEWHEEEDLSGLDAYWADLVRLLQVFALSKRRDAEGIRRLKQRMTSDVFHPFITTRIGAIES
jgi:thymidylate synthase